MRNMVIRSHIVHAPAPGTLQVFSPGYIVVDAGGKISHLGAEYDPARFPGASFRDALDRLLLPGLVDTHTHLAQFGFAGVGAHELLQWLETYTFPYEARFSDPAFAKERAERFFNAAVRLGTTTVSAYATSHPESVEAAFVAARRTGLRAFVGQVLMDRNAPEGLLRSVEQFARESEALIADWHGKGNLHYVVTPRFAISCTEPLLKLAGALSEAHDLVLQTHLSENLDEIAFTRTLFPEADSYASVYARTGCLTERTLLGHCIHLSRSERALIKKQGAVAVHCPTSNRFLGSGMMPLARWRDEGLRLSLGTDVAGGTSLSMFHEMKEALETAKTLRAIGGFTGEERAAGGGRGQGVGTSAIDLGYVLHLATLGGARSLGLGERIGDFTVGKDADFILVEDALCHPDSEGRFSGLEPSEGRTSPELASLGTVEERLGRTIYRSHPAMVEECQVAGRVVYRRT